jgi:hypothetical protein
MIPVEVRDEDRFERAAADRTACELMLRSFSTVEEEHAAVEHDREGRDVTVARRRGRSGAKEDDADLVHEVSSDQRSVGRSMLCSPRATDN